MNFVRFSIALLPYGLALFPGIWLINRILRRIALRAELADLVRDYLRLSEWIGVFERWLTIYFIQQGELSALGFIIAAKGLLRLPQLQKDRESPQLSYALSSYVLLGTLASVLLAILLAEGGMHMKEWAECW